MNTALLALVAGSLIAGQVIFKSLGVAILGQSLASVLLYLATSPRFYLAVGLYGTSTIVWIYVLSRVRLVEAYPWIAAVSVVVPLLGWLVFGERVTIWFWIGLLLVAAGLILTQIGSQAG